MLTDVYTRSLKRYDRDLYAGRTKDGVLCVFRKVRAFELVSTDEDFKLYNLKDTIQFVLALTDNWRIGGVPRQWGVDRVLFKLREMDTAANERFFEELDAQNERVDESKRRDQRNNMEAFFADNRREFAKQIDEIVGCTHTLSKDEPRKRLKDRSIKNGNS